MNHYTSVNLAQNRIMGTEHKRDHGHYHGPAWKRLHRDWRVWIVVLLMLAAMAAYLVSYSEVLRPGGGGQPAPPVPRVDGDAQSGGAGPAGRNSPPMNPTVLD